MANDAITWRGKEGNVGAVREPPLQGTGRRPANIPLFLARLGRLGSLRLAHAFHFPALRAFLGFAAGIQLVTAFFTGKHCHVYFLRFG